MPIFKLVFPSNRAKDGWETTRWNVRHPRESITYDMLLTRLRQIIDTPTSGYAVTWSDGEDVCSIRNTEDLQEAIDFFEENPTNDKCIRLMAEPVDKLDLFSAMELYATLNSSDANHVAGNTDDAGSISISAVSSTVDSNNERRFISRHPLLSIQANVPVTIKPEPPFDETKRMAADCGLKTSRGVFPVVREARSKRVSPAHVKPNTESPDNVKLVIEQPEGECVKHDLPNTQYQADNHVERKAQIQSDDFETEPLCRTRTKSDDVYDLSRQLYMMGFRFDEKTFKRTIRECNGDVNLIIDRLSKLRSE